MKSEALSFRPYARLLAMLGDQLIKNERIALVELIKNSYDADAGHVEVRFDNFTKKKTSNLHSRIVLKDDGIGMTDEIIRSRWMNPATPHKLLDKRKGRGITPKKNRVVQGEKGIGRFAILKLGRLITITTRTAGEHGEIVLSYDFRRYDDDFLSEDGEERDIFLDEIKIHLSRSTAKLFSDTEHGTIIEVQDLKGTWNGRIIKRFCSDISDLTDPVSRITSREPSNRFEIDVFVNGERSSVDVDKTEELRRLIDEKPVLRIDGRFNCKENRFSFTTDEVEDTISLQDAKITGLWIWRQRLIHLNQIHSGDFFGEPFICGDFVFHFYIFDFSRGITGRYLLSPEEKRTLKAHRIYLYRDDVRVYPYGDPEDDWLRIDVTRGTGRAGNFFSNDQIVGWIDVTHKGNPGLRDKTNREGLIESGGAAEDLIFLVRLFLSYVKQNPYGRYEQKKRQRTQTRLLREGVVTRRMEKFKQHLTKSGYHSEAREFAKIAKEYEREKKSLSERTEMTEDLAGVGLSVELASHDIMLLMNRALYIGKQLAKAAPMAGSNQIREQSKTLVSVLQQIKDAMKNIQGLFKSSRRRRKVLKIETELVKVHQIYKPVLRQRSIRYEVITVDGSPLVAKTTDAVLMLVLINLFDNASYWLESVDHDVREIKVTINGERETLTFSDSGPGIDPDDLPYIFEPFYSGKGKDGRGLGLYIARQVLDRHDYRITVAENKNRVLSGANFVVRFTQERV